MKRILLLGLLALLPASAAIGTTPASGESCFRVLGLEKGSYTNSSCNVGGPPLNWTWAEDSHNFTRLAVSPHIYCVKVRTALTSQYKDAVCSMAEVNTGLYTKVGATAGWIWGINPLKGRAKGIQTIHTTAGNIECEEMALSGEAGAAEEAAQILKVKYGKCKGFGASVTISEAEYEFSAEGQLGIVNKNVTVTDTEGGCTVTISAGGSNKSLGEANYTDATGKVDENSNVGGINYEPSGGACGTKKLETNGTDKGEGEVEEEGGGAAEVKLKPTAPTECEAKGFCFEGQQVTGSEKFTIVSENTAGSKAALSAAGLKLECETVKDGGSLLSEGKSEGTVELSKCTVSEPAHCKVAEPITFKIKDELVNFESKLADKFIPVSGTELFTLKFENNGGTCVLAGNVAAHGSLQALPDNETEAVEHVLTFSATSGSALELGGAAATFKLKDKVTLGGTVSGYKWSTKI